MKLLTKPGELYTTKEFRTLRDVLIGERTNKNEELICEHCGKPIYKKYDCIAHHIEEVTQQNMNDVNITLNPNNIKLIHFNCHNEIHQRWGFKKQQAYLVYGASCSGKTTYVKSIAKKDDLIVDMDSIWQMISINDKYIKPNTLKLAAFSIRNELYDVIKCRKGEWHNAYIIATMPRMMDRKRLCDELGAIEVFIDTDKDTCIQRLHENPAGRNIKDFEGYINDFFDNYQSSIIE